MLLRLVLPTTTEISQKSPLTLAPPLHIYRHLAELPFGIFIGYTQKKKNYNINMSFFEAVAVDILKFMYRPFETYLVVYNVYCHLVHTGVIRFCIT